MELKPSTVTAIPHYQTLLSTCFPHNKGLTPAYLQWMYAENPAGTVHGFDAWDGETLAAHYVCIPFRATLFGESVTALLSLNTATHPSYQGQGLFTKLAQATYDAATAAGYAAVVGVANANSTPGFIKKLGFQLVSPLLARFCLSTPAMQPSASPLDIAHEWNNASLAWRLANPNARYRAINGTHIAAATPYPFIEAVSAPHTAVATPQQGYAPRPIKIFIGLDSRIDWSRTRHIDLPDRLRPSPLNLIYKPLAARHKTLSTNLAFDFLDFDAY